MAQKIAGTAFLQIGSNNYALRGNLSVSPSNVERTMLAGMDGIHGYQELYRAPYIEGDLSTVPGLSTDDLISQTNANVIVQLANGRQYTLSEATCKATLEVNARDGQVRVRWEGINCTESTWGATVG